jgi:hypothetical protein
MSCSRSLVAQIVISVAAALAKSKIVIVAHDDFITPGFPLAQFSHVLFMAPATPASVRSQEVSMLQHVLPTLSITVIQNAVVVHSRPKEGMRAADSTSSHEGSDRNIDHTTAIQSQPIRRFPRDQNRRCDAAPSYTPTGTLDMMLLGPAHADSKHSVPRAKAINDFPTAPASSMLTDGRIAVSDSGRGLIKDVGLALLPRQASVASLSKGLQQTNAGLGNHSGAGVNNCPRVDPAILHGGNASNADERKQLVLVTSNRQSQVHKCRMLNQELVKVCVSCHACTC